MFKILTFTLCLVLYLVATVHAQQDKTQQDKTQKKAQSRKLQVGDQAPDWELVGTDGKTYKLSSFKGKQGVIVAWYPMALTGG